MIYTKDNFTATLPYSLWTAEQVKQAEPQLAHAAGTTLKQLMERAGQSAYACLRTHWPDATRLLVIAGGGNNGGDALVVARLASADGLHVELFMHADPQRFPEEASAAWQALQGVEYRLLHQLDEASDADLIIDGLLGSGLKGAVREEALKLIEQINATTVPVLALDIPSGLHADTGQPLGAAVKAAATVTFIGVKRGLLTGQAPQYCGELFFSDLGLASVLPAWSKTGCERMSYARLMHWLSPRSRVAHKGAFGRVVLSGGDLGTPGAIRLAGEACQRVGAGLIRVLTRPEHLAIVLGGRPELMVQGIPDAEQAPLIDEAMAWASVLVAGPGLGQSEWSHQLYQRVIQSDKPLVLDADGLNLLAQQPISRGNWILTPHPGEAARLLQCTVHDVESDRYQAARQLAERYQAIVVLKGAGTIIASAEGRLVTLNVGNPGMASGGMGDVLSGMIGGLIAQHIPLFDATCLAVCIHGHAADRAALQGERGMLASDLLPEIRALVNPEQRIDDLAD
ncbi:NAD(P)H-hydrate dehydratase [Celerinatantimonas sp. YJH-8]|uniref:NAD(P)H-hydrate dehydratase n=1 Tax=Celerinatantimonas sp. YJH-8 TaxID=3228714 RepID=UPI0038C1DDD2